MKREVGETLGAFLLITYGLVIGALFGSSVDIDTSTFASVAEAAADSATAIGILIGGAWAYKRYIERNEGDGHAELMHRVHAMNVDGGVLVRVTLEIKNAGQVEFRPARGDISVQLPPTSFVSDSEPCEMWLQHKTVPLPFSNNKFFLENGGTERYCRDFIVPSGTEWVQIHSNVFAEDGARWDETSLHQIRTPQNGLPAAAPNTVAEL